jgi:hypothetical protein
MFRSATIVAERAPVILPGSPGANADDARATDARASSTNAVAAALEMRAR